jgi:transglutaminase-like putative cysteine protease
MNGYAARFFQWLNPRELFKYLLLAVFLTAAVSCIAPLIYRSDLSLLLVAALAGLSIGWFTGRIPLPGWAAASADAALGAEFLLALVGRLDLPFIGWISSSVSGIGRLLVGDPLYATNVQRAIAEAGRVILGSITEGVRFRYWLGSLLQGEPVSDPAASAIFWGLLFFLMAAFAGWTLTAKGKPFAAAVPTLSLVGVAFAHTRGDWRYPFILMGIVFLMVVVVEYGRKEEEWDRKRIGYSTTLRIDLTFSAFPVLAGLLLITYLIPSVSLSEIARWVREQSQQTGGAATAGGASGGPITGIAEQTGPTLSNDFIWSHFLGRGTQLSDTVVMVVVTGETIQPVPGNPSPVPPRHYWKSVTFDFYSSSGWTADVTKNQFLPAKGTIGQPLPNGRRLHQSVALNRSGQGPIYAAGELVTVDQPFWVAIRSNGDLMGGMITLPRYEADSIVLEPDESALRAAGTDYPDWIRSRYLQLPNPFPGRVAALARDLTATYLTPYDQALAIQDYLRKEMHYSTTVGFPPPNRDVVDFFLFDSKVGFCDYYASAMVVLARAAGIPARYAMGYAPGIFDPAQGRFLVRESDSHAWPELFFPGIGWVEFEPTSAIPVIQRSALPSNPLASPAWLKGSNPVFSAVWNFLSMLVRRFGAPVLAVGLALLFAYLAWILLTPVRFILLPSPRMLRGMYRTLIAHGRRLGIPFSRATTPAEFGILMAGIYPAGADPIQRLVELYSRMVYGAKKISPPERRAAVGNWLATDRGLWRIWIRKKFLRRPDKTS